MFFVRAAIIASITLCSVAIAQPSPNNVIPITIGGLNQTPNVPVVNVTVCKPGTDECQTIPNILLDTGSVGLRIFSHALTVKLKNLELPEKQVLTECFKYAGGDQYWGPIKKADVVLGNDRAKNLHIQVVNGNFSQPTGQCTSNPLNENKFYNGILGVSAGDRDCKSDHCRSSDDPRYYSCASHRCEKTMLMENHIVQNPISLMGENNNGYVINFPQADSIRDTPISGTLTLGLGTQANNQPAPLEELKMIKTDALGWFRLNFKGKTYWSMLDTGTPIYYLPASFRDDYPCEKSGAWKHYLCPSETIRLKIDFENSSTEIIVGNAKILYEGGSKALDNMAAKSAATALGDESTADSFMLLGMPYFYGKTIYVGLNRRQTPLGPGPFNAIKD